MKKLIIIFSFAFIGCQDNMPEEANTHSKSMEQIELSDGTCADIIFTYACHNHICTHHVNSIVTDCKAK